MSGFFGAYRCCVVIRRVPLAEPGPVPLLWIPADRSAARAVVVSVAMRSLISMGETRAMNPFQCSQNRRDVFELNVIGMAQAQLHAVAMRASTVIAQE